MALHRHQQLKHSLQHVAGQLQDLAVELDSLEPPTTARQRGRPRKLTEPQEHELADKVTRRVWTAKQAAEHYGVSLASVYHIRARHSTVPLYLVPRHTKEATPFVESFERSDEMETRPHNVCTPDHVPTPPSDVELPPLVDAEIMPLVPTPAHIPKPVSQAMHQLTVPAHFDPDDTERERQIKQLYLVVTAERLGLDWTMAPNP